MSIKFDVTINQRTMFDFMLYHTYTSIIGVIGVIFGMVNLTLGVRMLTEGESKNAMLYLVFAAVFLLAMPIVLWRNAGSQVRSVKMFEAPIQYELTEEGVYASQNETGSTVPWTGFIRVVSTRSSIIMYQSRNRAVIFPRADLGEQQDAVIEMISTHIEPSRVKIRR